MYANDENYPSGVVLILRRNAAAAYQTLNTFVSYGRGGPHTHTESRVGGQGGGASIT